MKAIVASIGGLALMVTGAIYHSMHVFTYTGKFLIALGIFVILLAYREA